MNEKVDLVLHEFPRTRSARCRWMLQEVGAPFRAVLVDLRQGEHRTAEFLKLNPLGKVPVLVDGDLVLTESVAICSYLGDKFFDAGLVPPVGTAERALHDSWLLFCATELEQPLWRIRRHTVLYPPEKRLPADVDLAREDFGTVACVLEEALRGQETLMGDRFTAADIVVAYTLQWATTYELLASFPVLEAYLRAQLSRPACPAELKE